MIDSMVQMGVMSVYIQDGEDEEEVKTPPASAAAEKNIEKLRTDDRSKVTLSASVRERVAQGIQYVYSNVIKEDAMKHYIYLTEDKLYYIRKENRARGYSFMGSRTITGPETVTGAMESLADIYNLKGRAVVLAIEASVKIHFMSLPASSKKTALQMA